jgi:DNA-binding transcriptional LysR family regulator
MELRDIEYFAVVAEHGHLGRAATALGLSQPALSKSLRRLEQALQVRLVNRTPKGVELTVEGRILMGRVRELRLSLQSVAREVADVSKGRVGHLRIGVGFPGLEQFLSAAFAAALNDAPRIKLIVSTSDNDLMLPSLRNGEIDLVVNYLPVSTPTEGLICEHLYDEEYVVCASAKHRLAERKRVTLADLADERWALSHPALHPYQKLHEIFREHGLAPPRIALEARSVTLRLRTVASSDLLDWTSRIFVEQSPLASALRVLNIKEMAWLRPIGVIRRQEGYLPPAVGRFIDIIKRMTKQMDALR